MRRFRMKYLVNDKFHHLRGLCFVHGEGDNKHIGRQIHCYLV